MMGAAKYWRTWEECHRREQEQARRLRWDRVAIWGGLAGFWLLVGGAAWLA